MNLTQLVSLLLGLRSWASSGATLESRIKSGINLALNKFSLEAPGAFYPVEEHVVLYADQTTAGTSRYLMRVSADPWVLDFRDATGAAFSVLGTDDWLPVTTGEWAGIMHLEVQDEDGVWHRRQSRSFWFEDSGGVRYYYVSLDRPFPVGSNSAKMAFRIHQPAFYTRDDVLRMDSCMAWDGNNVKAQPVSAGSADLLGMVDYQGGDTGFPEFVVNSSHFQLPAPNFTPTVVEDIKNAWTGPESEGSFIFKYTYVRGKRDNEWQESEGLGVNDPMWESAPSPASAEVVQATPGRLVVQLPNVDWMQSFDIAGTKRQTHSGWRKRVYVARTGVLSLGVGLEANVESAGIFYLLGEVDGSVTTFVWYGEVTPDYSRRLRHSTGYYAWKVWPHQDQRYELDLRVCRTQEELVASTDTPRVKPQASSVLMELCLYYACLLDGVDVESANFHLDNYERQKGKLLAVLAGRGGALQPTSWSGGVNTARRNLGTFSLE